MSFFDKLGSLGGDIKDTLNDAAHLVSNAWDEYIPSVGDVTGVASNVVDMVSSGASDAANFVVEAWDEHVPSIDDVAEIASNVGEKVASSADSVATLVKEHPGSAMLGAGIGVLAVAAAPFTGGGSLLGGASLLTSLAGAGAVTVATATATAGAGVAISNIQTKKTESTSYNKGREKGKAESAVNIEELSRMVVHAAKAYSEQTRRDEFIISLAAIGLSMAACDGSISSEESACVEEYVIGMSKFVLPQNIRDFLNKMVENPPLFEDAIVHVKKLDRDIWPCIDGLLEVIGEADGDINPSEQEFLTKWENYKSIALEEGALA